MSWSNIKKKKKEKINETNRRLSGPERESMRKKVGHGFQVWFAIPVYWVRKDQAGTNDKAKTAYRDMFSLRHLIRENTLG